MEKTVLHLEELAVEFPRSGLSKDQLTQAVKGLPELFKTYFHETGIVEVEHVTVTVGSFPSATAQALTEGGVDVAFLPGTTAAALDGPVVLLADARLLDDGATLRSGTRALLCAAPTAYGDQLVGRVSSGKPLSHTEAERARWGMVETGAARDCFTLWLADSFGEEQAFDWSAVTMYGSEEELFWAAANGEIDALVIRDDARTGAAESWAGEGSIWEQLPVLDVTETPDALRDYLNRYLPDAIAVREVKEAAPRFHARYNALGKTYRYTCHTGPVKPVFDRKYVTLLDYDPDVEKMRQAAAYLLGENDFASFCGNPRMKKSTVRLVDHIAIERRKDRVVFTFHGTGFLQNMVRIMVGTLLEVGRGYWTPEQVRDILSAKDRKQAGPTAPPEGLCLMKVDY